MSPTTLFLATLFVTLMGFAIQRGATCTVAAIEEILTKRRAHRLAAMFEASLWVSGGLVLAQTLGVSIIAPTGYTVTWMTFAGGALLGLGAYVNKACVFGAIARFGSGEWAYLATPVGFLFGAYVFHILFSDMGQLTPKLGESSPLIHAPVFLTLVFTVFFIVRIGRAVWHSRAQLGGNWLHTTLWSPWPATVIIGIAFVNVLLLVGGTWAYTDVLSELAHGITDMVGWRVLLLFALLSGAVVGGVTAGRFNSTIPNATHLLRCFLGGALMAFGGLLIPGSNDGLILIGLPLMFSYAWLAFGTMCGVIALAQWRAQT